MIQNIEPKPLSDDWFDGDPSCHACNGTGWRHGCMDDLCRGSTDDEDCPDAIQCMVCNPKGDWF